MTIKAKQLRQSKICRTLFIGLVMSLIMVSAAIVNAQSTDANTGSTSSGAGKSDEETYNGYTVAATVEFGYRYRSLEGNENKYRSDLNYKKGFRSFDSNLWMNSETGKGKYFDSLLISNSGWGADPTGYFRVNMEKIGVYKFNSTVRRIDYFNNLSTFTAVPDPNQHNQNTQNLMGDFDVTILPQNHLFRLNLGASFGSYTGPGNSTMRWNSDEFRVDSNGNNKTADYRVGADGKVAGFDWGLLQGIHTYRDRTSFEISSVNPGHATPANTTPANTTVVNSFSRSFPVDGLGYFTQFNLHRTIADKLDITGRVIYSSTRTNSSLDEWVVGRDGSNNFIDSDHYSATASSNRPQTRADIGLTYNVTNDFRISNTFTFDQFSLSGGEFFNQLAIRRNSAGVSIAPTIAASAAYRFQSYRRFLNTLEGDYQFNKQISVHLGWRYTKRRVADAGYDLNTISGVNSLLAPGLEENSTNTLIAGMRIKPIKHWTLYWDVEHGSADNVFGRLENYNFTNFRIRSKVTVDKFSFDVAVITKNNKNPEFAYPAGSTIIPSFGFTPVTDIKSEFYSVSASWDPDKRVNVSGGYTYRHQDSFSPLIFPYQACTTPACTAGTSVWNTGYSEYFMHDHYGYLEVAANPMNRVTFYATFRMNKDTGQNGLLSPTIPNTFGSAANPIGVPVYVNVLSSYPMSFLTPEFRVAFRLTKNIDWNIGYQYFKFTDVNTPSQNYAAHLPFTSLRIYFGGPTADRLK